MAWLGKLGATILLFIGSILGFSHQAQNAGPVQSPPTQQQTSGSVSNDAYGGRSNTSTQSAVTVSDLMQQIGCSDATSCERACMRTGMTPACTQLQSAMVAQMSAHTTGSPSGPSQGSGVAFVGNNSSESTSALPACPSDNALLNYAPITAIDLSGIEPLGHMNGEHILPSQADHVYFLANPSESSAVIYAPGNTTLLAIAESTGIAGADAGANSVKLYFSPCKSVLFALQINTLSPQLEKVLSKLKPTNVQAGATVQNTLYDNLNISLASGEELGTVVSYGAQGGQADFAAVDMRSTPLAFIDQNEGTGMLADSYQHAVCPLDYFTSALKSTLYSALTTKNVGANGIPACGSTMQDKARTAQGDWYKKDAATASYQGINEGSLLAIAHYNLDPSQGIVSVGTDLIPSSYLGTQLIFQPQSSGYINREPSQITSDGTVYCFDGPMGAGGKGTEGHIDIRLDSATKLEADYGTGACVASPTLSSPVTYDR